MITCQEINSYLKWVEEHPEKVNEERLLLIKNVVIPTLQMDDIFFDEVVYHQCIAYCEYYFYTLFPYQKFIYAFFFMYKNGLVLFPNIVILMGRGNGKDGSMMPLMNFLQTPMYGVENYHIDIVANSEDPARNSFKVVHDMLESHSSKFENKFYWNKEEIINRKTKSILRFNTSNAKTKYGKQTGLVLFNELHTYEDFSQIKTFKSGLGKIKHPRTVIISTQGYVREGPLDQILDICLQVIHGEPNDMGYFPFICKIDSDEEIDKPEAWIKANPSMEFMPNLAQQIYNDYVEMKKMASLRAEFITMRMNLPRRNEAMTIASWEKILRSTYEDIEAKTIRELPSLKDKMCIIGVDFADIRDFVSVYFVFKVDGNICTFGHTWICSRSPFFKDIKFPLENVGQPGYEDYEIVDTPSIDALEIVKWIVVRMREYRVRKIIMDNYRFQMIRQHFEAFGISIESKTNPHGLVRMIRNFPSVMAMVAPVIEYNFAEEKIIAGNSALWRWFVNNTGVKIDGNGNKAFFKVEPKLRKNDGFMAFAAAISEEGLLEEKVFYI